MRRILPDSLFGRTMAVLLGGLIVSHLAGFLIYYGHREEATRAVGGYAIAQRIANLARLVDEAPPEWRQKIIAASNDPSLSVSISDSPLVLEGGNDSVALSVRDYLMAQPAASGLPEPRVAAPAVTRGRQGHHHQRGPRRPRRPRGRDLASPTRP